jgi:hypothetical protein
MTENEMRGVNTIQGGRAMISYPITICPRCGSVSCIRPGGWDTTDVCER